MTTVRVAIPVLKGKRRFHIEKGRPWTLVEHIVLVAIVAEARTVAELASKANLPRRLVLEALIRLMRAGWVELSLAQESQGVVFRASKTGIDAAKQDELPNVPKLITRWVSFVIDKISGTLYRSGEIPFYPKHIVDEIASRERLIWMKNVSSDFDEPRAVIDTLLNDDEKFVGADRTGERLLDRFALITVRNGVVEDLPARSPNELRLQVLEASKKAPMNPLGVESPSFGPSVIDISNFGIQEIVDAKFRHEDILIGGPEHQQAFESAIRNAKRRIIIHSTFISSERFGSVRQQLYDAARRGVQVDILWGEDEYKKGGSSSLASAKEIRNEIEQDGFKLNIRVALFSTFSHAKIVIADEGRTGRLFALVGSCNWLASGFQSIETSLCLRDPRLVAAIIQEVSELTRGADGHWTELTSDLVRLSAVARDQKAPTGIDAEMSIVIGPQHANYIRQARDEAANRLFVTSHRIGSAMNAAVIVPAIAAAQARGLPAQVYYGTKNNDVTNTDVAEQTREAVVHDVQIRPIYQPRIHAKILAWDNDYAVITSQNWLSADPSDANRRREIGIYVHAHGVSRNLIERFEAKTHY